MMRVVFLLIVSLCFFKADAQLPWKYPGAGIQMRKMLADSVARIPSDTTNNKTGIAQIGGVFYVGNGTYWNGVASVSDVIANDTAIYALQQALVDSSAAIRADIPSQSNQLLFGGTVTEISHLQFFITAADYRIGGKRYQTRDTTISLSAAGDSDRIDIFKVDTFGITTAVMGAMSSNPVPPTVNPSKELLLNFVFLGTDTIYTPTITPVYWTQSGADIININAGNVLTGNQFRATGGFNVTPALSGTTFNGIRFAGANTVDMFVGNNNVSRWFLVGNGSGAFYDLFGTFNAASGTGTGSAIKLRTSVVPAGANAKNYYQLEIVPTYTQGVFGTGTLAGVYYNPTINSLNTSTHYAWWSTSGGFRVQGLGYSADTTYLGLCIDASGNFYRCPRSTGSGGGGGISRQELIDSAAAIRASMAVFQQRMYDSLAAIRGAIPAPGVTRDELADSTSAVRNYTTENIKYVAAGDGVVMTVIGDTARFSVDTTYLQNFAHPYKSYIALLTQNGTNAPTVTELYNNTGATITFSYLTAGVYTINNSNGWDMSKLFFIASSVGNTGNTCCPAGRVMISSEGAYVLLQSFDNSNANANSVLADAPIEIRIYN